MFVEDDFNCFSYFLIKYLKLLLLKHKQTCLKCKIQTFRSNWPFHHQKCCKQTRLECPIGWNFVLLSTETTWGRPGLWKKNIPRRVTTLESQCCRPQKHTICEPPASRPAPPRMPNIRAWEEFRKEIFVHLTMLQRPAANKNGFHVRTFLARTFRSKWTCLFCGRKGFPPLEKGSTKAWFWPCRVFWGKSDGWWPLRMPF